MRAILIAEMRSIRPTLAGPVVSGSPMSRTARTPSFRTSLARRAGTHRSPAGVCPMAPTAGDAIAPTAPGYATWGSHASGSRRVRQLAAASLRVGRPTLTGTHASLAAAATKATLSTPLYRRPYARTTATRRLSRRTIGTGIIHGVRRATHLCSTREIHWPFSCTSVLCNG